MDQKKIGSFIKNRRIEKGLTQIELANKLNVTDKAISNYENGRRIPDISILKELSNILDVSINELLNGEVINADDLQEKCDENIISVMNNSKKFKKRMIFFIVGIILSLIIVLFINVYIGLNKECDATTYNLYKYDMNNLYNISIVDELDTKYFNKMIYIQSEIKVDDNQLFVMEDNYNKSNKISNIVSLEPWDKVDIIRNFNIIEIDDVNQFIVIYLDFVLDYAEVNDREKFITKYTFKYEIINDELNIELIDEYEFTEKNYSYEIIK